MYEASRLKNNINIFDECKKLIVQHNDLSYKKVKLDVPSITYDMINNTKVKIKDSCALDIIRFYEDYTSQIIMIKELKTIIDSVSYTNEDLMIHIDRSHDSIVQIFSALTETRRHLEECHERIIANVASDVDTFIEYIKSNIGDSPDGDEIIDVVFKCMHQTNLAKKLNIDDLEPTFIDVGRRLIEVMYDKLHLSEDQLSTIRILVDELKRKILKVNLDSVHTSINRLQRFGIVPDDGDNIGIREAMKKLLGIDINHVGSLNPAIDNLSKTLKVAESKSGVSAGLIIALSPNEDNYFDMSGLYSSTTQVGSKGVNECMIKTFDLIKEGNKPTIKEAELLLINVDQQKTTRAFVLWTNDMIAFKVKAKPIDSFILRRLLRMSPSRTIEAYNSALETSIKEARSVDAISFNRVKYMSFNETTTEDSFLNSLQNRLVTAITKKVGNLQGSKLSDAVTDDKFIDMILDIIELAKSDLGIHSNLLSSHCKIIYASMANGIASKLKKYILTQSSLTSDSIKEIVNQTVVSNNNIYSRTIASYYLHMA